MSKRRSASFLFAIIVFCAPVYRDGIIVDLRPWLDGAKMLTVAAYAVPVLAVVNVPLEFVLFGLTLLSLAIFHHRTMRVAVAGLVIISAYKVAFTGFKTAPGLAGLWAHLADQWVILLNLLCLLTAFALLSRHFEKSHVPVVLPRFLPHDWKGGFVLLLMIWILSSFLDNIAAALIGGAIAHQLFRAKVHTAFLAAIVAASNAGGAWSVVGDTTTTMMWVAGVSPAAVFEAIIAATVAVLLFAIPAAKRQHSYSPILQHAHAHTRVDWARVGIVTLTLVFAIAINIGIRVSVPSSAERFPFLGIAVWLALLISVPLRRPDWEFLPRTIRGSIFLLALVLCASMMPVEELPAPSWQTVFGLGLLSAVFNNIPLTALALKQGGYDWGFLAYAVGFGGSIIWFGSSAGVAVCTLFPEARSVTNWLRDGWWIAAAYVIAFFVMLGVWQWHPDKPRPVNTVSATIPLTK
jgi:Na+/H+ antiporter NhaD/arsenite permease-like protein